MLTRIEELEAEAKAAVAEERAELTALETMIRRIPAPDERAAIRNADRFLSTQELRRMLHERCDIFKI